MCARSIIDMIDSTISNIIFYFIPIQEYVTVCWLPFTIYALFFTENSNIQKCMFVLSMYNVLPCMYCMKNYICCVRMQAQRCALRIELFMLFLLNLSSCYFIFLN